MKSFVVTGPESTGKTWLCSFLAEHYHSSWRPEYLRTYFEKYNGIEKEQMEIVAKRQLDQELVLLNQKEAPIFFDTNLINLKVYYQYYFKQEPDWFEELYQPKLYHHYILLDTTVPWEKDPQRDSPKVREEIFQNLKKEYALLNVPFDLVTGDYSQRKSQTIQIIDNLC